MQDVPKVLVAEVSGMAVSSSDSPIAQEASQVKSNPPHCIFSLLIAQNDQDILLLTNENQKDKLQQQIERLKEERDKFKQGMEKMKQENEKLKVEAEKELNKEQEKWKDIESKMKQEIEELKNEGEKWKKQQVCAFQETDKYFVVTFRLAGNGENCDKITRSRAQNSQSSKQQKWISQNSRVG